MTSLEADLLIVGGGIAGLVAALRAVELGARVIVFERQSEERYLNASRVTGGVFHCCLKDVMTPPAELERSMISRGGDAVRVDLAHAVAGDASRAIAWLRTKGAKFMRGSPHAWHSHVLAPPNLARYGLAWQGRGGDQLLRNLEAGLTRHGGTLKRGHDASALTVEAGRVTGVRGTSDKASFEARGVVLLADGGFQSDLDLVRQHISPAPERLLQRNVGSGRGTGLRMALAAGACTSRLDAFYGHIQARRAMEDDRLWPYPWWDDVAVQGILVTAEGRRFCDEGLGGPFMANRIAALEDPLSAFVVFDETIWNSGGRSRYFPANPNLTTGGAEMFSAGTLADLAVAAGIAKEALEETVNAHNAGCASAAFAPPRTQRPFPALPISTAPFHAAPVCAGITYTMGGIAIDADGRALRADGRAISGLFAAGATTGGLEGGDRVSYVGGLVKSSVTALRAAEAAVSTT